MAVPVLLVTKGHPFERAPFLAMFDHLVDLGAITYEHVEHPDAEARLDPARLAPARVVVFYDMPGLRFTRADPPLELVEPSPSYVAGFEALLAAGVGMVFLHHAMAGWPSWPRYAEVVGARFLYQPGVLRGSEWPDSGYLLDVDHTVGMSSILRLVMSASHCAAPDPGVSKVVLAQSGTLSTAVV